MNVSILMDRKKLLFKLLVAIYLVSFFLPSVNTVIFGFKIKCIGYESAYAPVAMMFEIDWLESGFVSEILTNLFIMFSNLGVVFVFFFHMRISKRVQVGCSLLSVLSVIYWLFTIDAINELQVGYWLWGVSIMGILAMRLSHKMNGDTSYYS